MATIYQRVGITGAQFQATAFPAFVRNGTNFTVVGLAYDAAAVESAYWTFRATSYGSGNLTVGLDWYADTATTGVVRWGTQIAAITPDTDTQDVETKALATAQTADDTHLGTTGQRLHRIPITVSNLDSLANQDAVWIRIYRDAANAADTLTGDAILVGVTISYSDT